MHFYIKDYVYQKQQVDIRKYSQYHCISSLSKIKEPLYERLKYETVYMPHRSYTYYRRYSLLCISGQNEKLDENDP